MNLNDKIQERLHNELAEALLEMLHAEPCAECKRSYPGAKELTVIRQFLADNGTTADLRTKTPLRNLADDLPNFEDPEGRVEKEPKRKKA